MPIEGPIEEQHVSGESPATNHRIRGEHVIAGRRSIVILMRLREEGLCSENRVYHPPAGHSIANCIHDLIGFVCEGVCDALRVSLQPFGWPWDGLWGRAKRRGGQTGRLG